MGPGITLPGLNLDSVGVCGEECWERQRLTNVYVSSYFVQGD